ncbi:MAG TPA: OFA family MFS transporter [Gemmatimonadaceae bacterium]|nr:OFA family MFS transporter [Gemmatimonadaceae bacterium]
MTLFAFLDREHTIAPPGYSRWLVPPAALAIHLSIGQVYAFSVFNLPLSRLIGITESAPGDWKLSTIGWVFSVAIVFLGVSAALFGSWLERVGPRKAMFASALCFSGGFLVAALGVWLHQFWLLVLGYGVLGGIGLGLGYISPVSTLIKWFPDRPGMATGMAIMGFGGGAMIASPLAVALMDRFRTPESQGVAQTFLTMGILYFAYMMFGVFMVRVPPPGWAPAGYTPSPRQRALVTTHDVRVNEAMRTPQFWLLWVMLCVNVTAGIGVLGQASPMIQEMFPGVITVAAAAGFVGLLSLSNMSGRFIWSSLSDVIGRKMTYAIFFALGTVLYSSIPTTGRLGSVVLFVIGYVIILSMYGGGFATIPAYLRDLFGTAEVGAIHGRLLTAWSTAGVLGPVLVNYIREYQIGRGVPKAEAYSLTMYLMAGLLVIGFVCNLAVRPVHPRHHVPPPDRGVTPVDTEAARAVASTPEPGTAARGPGHG